MIPVAVLELAAMVVGASGVVASVVQAVKSYIARKHLTSAVDAGAVQSEYVKLFGDAVDLNKLIEGDKNLSEGARKHILEKLILVMSRVAERLPESDQRYVESALRQPSDTGKLSYIEQVLGESAQAAHAAPPPEAQR